MFHRVPIPDLVTDSSVAASLSSSRNPSGVGIKRMQSQKSMRKGLARGSLAMLSPPSLHVDPVDVSPMVETDSGVCAAPSPPPVVSETLR